jgi:hypothetical protein
LKDAPAIDQIVICGFARSGSTLLYNMLRNTALDVFAPEKEAGAGAYAGMLDKCVITKRPLDVFSVDGIRKRLRGKKGLKIILTMRDPRSLITSSHSSAPGEYFQGFDNCYLVRADGHLTYTNPGVVPTEEAMRKVIADNAYQVHVVRYEDLVTSPGVVQEKLGAFTGLATRGSFADFHKSEIPATLAHQLNGIRPVDAAGMTRWKLPEHAARIVRQFRLAPELFEIVERWGYAGDRRWFDELAATAPEALDDLPGTIVGYYTRGTLYETEARRMLASIAKLGLPVDLTPLESVGDWLANVRHKPDFLLDLRRRLRGPLLYVDVDAVVHRNPWPYLRGYTGDAAIACHPGGDAFSGTLLLNDTVGAVRLLENWIEEQARDPAAWDQHSLHKAVLNCRLDSSPARIHVQDLPSSMCKVFDRTYEHLRDPYIEHLQASREIRAAGGIARDVENLARRRRRIAELHGQLSMSQPRAEAASLAAEAVRNAKAGNHALAVEQFRRLYRDFPDDLEADSAKLRRHFGLCLIRSGEVAAGLAETSRAVALGRPDPIQLMKCVDNFIAARNVAAGRETLDLLPDDARTSPDVQLRRARLLYLERRRDDLVDLLEALLQHPNLTPATRAAAVMWLDRGKALPSPPPPPPGA